jgi:YjbE family integral membrane protein
LQAGYSHYFIDCLSIIAIDLLLAGDNALVIALASRALPQKQRRMALLLGAWLAVLIRVAVTFVAARLLTVEFLQFAGGAFVIWIALKVLGETGEPKPEVASPRQWWRAMLSIMIADLTMSTDNILAVAGASRGNLWLILFGLALSIPMVVTSSTLLVRLMDRFPLTLYLGVAILTKVGGDMMLTDAFVRNRLHPSDLIRYAFDAILVVLVLGFGRMLARRKRGLSADS